MMQTLEDLRIIIIDDQSTARAMLRAMLKEIGINQVFEAPDGRDGLTFLDNAGDMVDVVICDWNMPKMTGVELLRQVRSAGIDIPFLMVTGRTDRESVLQAKTAGVTGYIAKPFSYRQLEAKLRALLGRTPAPRF
ncbi:MAG: response regulator [Alphaproteobacteria bacterium]|nr:response regulator [Alphaproteobacteria bacterium]